MQCGHISAWKAAIAAPATSASASRVCQSAGDSQARPYSKAPPSKASDSHTGDKASHTANAIVVGREDEEAERRRRRPATPHKRAAGPARRRSATQNSTIAGAGDREIDDHLEPDGQRQRGRDAERQAAADALGIGDRRRRQREQRELPAVMIDPLGHEHAVGRAGEEQGEERRADRRAGRSAAAPSAPARTAAADRAAAARSRPPSARPPARRGTAEAPRINPAIGKSTSRDQWMLAPNGGFSRYWRRSNQPWPWSRPRTCIIRILSSVSPSVEDSGCRSIC